MQQAFFEFPTRSVMTFDNFIICDGNRNAFNFAKRVADRSEPDKLLFVYAPAGSGKTHLATAAAEVMESRVIDGKKLADPEQLSHLDGSAPLIIDDVDMINLVNGVNGALWQLFNDCYSAGTAIILTASKHPKELAGFDDHLKSRFVWGLVARCDASDDESRRFILKKRASDLNVKIGDELIEYILVTTSREVGSLLNAFEQLYRYSLAFQKKMTVQLARKLYESGKQSLL